MAEIIEVPEGTNVSDALVNILDEEKQVETETVELDTEPVDTQAEGENIVQYKNYYFGDIEKYMEEIDKLSFIECASLQKSIRRDLDNLEECREVLTTLAQMQDAEQGKEVDDLSIRLAQSNYLSEHYFHDADLDEFNKNYDQNHEALERLLDKLNEKVENNPASKSSRLLNEEMIHLLEKNQKALNPEAPNYKFANDKANTVIEAFSNRLDLTYLKDKVTMMMQNKATVRELKKMSRSGGKDLEKGLRKIFSQRQIFNFVNLCHTEVFQDDKTADLFIAALSKIARNESRSGKNAWVKIVILNFSEIVSEIYDFGDPNVYFETIRNTFTPILNVK